MPVQGQSREFDEQPNFTLEIDGIEVAYFDTCSAFEDESGVIEQRAGGSKDVIAKTDGVRKVAPITCTRGADSKNFDLYDWRQEVVVSGSFKAKRNGSIVALNSDGSVKGRINLIGAWPSKYTYGSWDASNDETVKEELVLQIDRAARIKL